jgi:hypothetical protein
LFEGKTRSNDMSLLTESKLLDDIAAELKRNSVLKQLGMDTTQIDKDEAVYEYLRLRFYPDPQKPDELDKNIEKKLVEEYKTAIEKELLKIVGKDYMPMLYVWQHDEYSRYSGIEMSITDMSYDFKKKSAGTSMIEILANLNTAEIRKIEKSIHIEDGYVEGMDREVNGTIEIAGKEFPWNMDTSDGQSTSYLGDEEDEDYVLHDILIDAVEDAGYALDDEDEDDGSDPYTP